MKKANITLFGAFVMLSLLFGFCKEEIPVVVPDVYVDFIVNLGLPQFSALNAEGNAVKVTGQGYNNNGIIIYRRFDASDGQLFFAFDATCPQHINTNASVNLEGGEAVCPHCSTRYYLENFGFPSNGYPLKRYRASLLGQNLHIYN